MPRHEFLNEIEEPFYVITTDTASNGSRYYIEGINPVTKATLLENDVKLPPEVNLDDMPDDEWLGVSVEVGQGEDEVYFFRTLEESSFVLKNIVSTYENDSHLQSMFDGAEFPFYVERVKPRVELTKVSESELLIANLSNDLATEADGNNPLNWYGDEADYDDEE